LSRPEQIDKTAGVTRMARQTRILQTSGKAVKQTRRLGVVLGGSVSKTGPVPSEVYHYLIE
jgi:hypothetical protein